MAVRANWKGAITIGDMTCPVALYMAVAPPGRIALHVINRATGHRVQRHFIDSETGEDVAPGDQVKGYETPKGELVLLERADIAAATPESDKTLRVSAFVRCADIDELYLDRPYYLMPAAPDAAGLFRAIHDSLAAEQVAAVAQAVLFRRVRTLLVRAYQGTLVATTLNYDYQLRPAQEAFSTIPDHALPRDMLELAERIIAMKRGTFDPATFEDRYEAALAALVQAKSEGKPLPKPHPLPAANVIPLFEALRESAAMADKGAPTPRGSARKGGAKGATGPATNTPSRAGAPRGRRKAG
ncbi:Ku protein [Acetobacter sp. TBRC 12305]|uniref:Non-homologous end joining protein Ku n=1 Tax=Acetobacter garciniae TaxID=2817435 RepID=A0A939HP68_9PROT|nr:Ku protein [Acetobacter garciniae]MBO1325147.1 Ku protein [Acetobacter garciniae]MBX0344882.1 Ku protein [Acetobacter garciniae]